MSFKHQASAYIQYLWKAKNEHSVHSPFLFKLLIQAFYKAKSNNDLEALDTWYKNMCQSDESFQFEDFGAGSHINTAKTRQVGEFTKAVGKPKKYRHLMYHLCAQLQPKSILELGSATGVSGAYMAKGYSSSKLISIEGSSELAQIASREWDQLGIKNAIIKSGEFNVHLDSVLSELKPLDLAYIDGNHQEEPTLAYFEKVLEYGSENLTIIFDDIYWSEGMTKAWEKIKAHSKVRQSVDVFQMGVVFTNPDLSKQDFIIRY